MSFGHLLILRLSESDSNTKNNALFRVSSLTWAHQGRADPNRSEPAQLFGFFLVHVSLAIKCVTLILRGD